MIHTHTLLFVYIYILYIYTCIWCIYVYIYIYISTSDIHAGTKVEVKEPPAMPQVLSPTPCNSSIWNLGETMNTL